MSDESIIKVIREIASKGGVVEFHTENINYLLKERDALKAKVEEYRKLEADLCAEIVKLKAVLRWYATDQDRGQRARQALGEEP